MSSVTTVLSPLVTLAFLALGYMLGRVRGLPRKFAVASTGIVIEVLWQYMLWKHY